jgi:SpoVK/Ycf46/Vps4 family AAA+-type ATPase
MDAVRSMLEEDRYFELIQRLKQKSLPMSTNILLYGAPGTGKTESVYQIARATGREIMKVEISQMKSMWFGESEKIIKKVFTDYTEYCSHTPRTPILLFNEADAILGTRNSFGGGNTRQTENAIQNILLEELENFKGIFIATTNLVQNLDKAFERRFLFKVEFNKPSVESRQMIWMDRILTLTENDALELANNFDLSGGQIENIVRKCEIEFILKGQEASLQNIMRFCSEENLSGVRSTNRIGF